MQQPWLAERTVSIQLASELISSEFPSLAPVSVNLLGEGWDNIAYLVNGNWVFRFPRREVAVPLLRTENNALRALAPLLPLQVPVPRFYSEGTSLFNWPFSGYEIIRSGTACGAHLSRSERVAIAPVLARFLRRLHSFPVDEATILGIRPDNLGRTDVKSRVAKTNSWFDNLERHKKLTSIEREQLALTISDAVNVESSSVCVVHGDLYSRHIVVDQVPIENDISENSISSNVALPQRALTGIIDWGDLNIGHPAIDLGIMYSFLPPEAESTFLQEYGELDTATRLLARFRATSHSAAILNYALEIADEDLIREARFSLEFIIERHNSQMS